MAELRDIASSYWTRLPGADKTKRVHQALSDHARLGEALGRLSRLAATHEMPLPKEILFDLQQSADGIGNFSPRP